MLRPMFVYRHRQLADDLAAHARARAVCPDPLTIAVTGSGGLIGTALTALLTTGGHRVVRLVRRPPAHAGERYWQPDDPGPDLLSGIDAVIHLAGASIGGRFTPTARQASVTAGSARPAAWPPSPRPPPRTCARSSRRRPSGSTARTEVTKC